MKTVLLTILMIIMMNVNNAMAGEVKFVVETSKSVAEAQNDLEAALQEMKFGVLHIHNVTETLQNKGFEMEEQIYVYEVCNPEYASKVLAVDLSMNMALPCRISIYTENGKTMIGMINPSIALAMMSDDANLKKIAMEVEKLLKKAIEQAK
jgi:uncharacterized protein (DUF302 family)